MVKATLKSAVVPTLAEVCRAADYLNHVVLPSTTAGTPAHTKALADATAATAARNALLLAERPRVTAAQIRAAVAAYPSGGKSGKNTFGGRAGDSRASVWDYCLVACPDNCWNPADVASVYAGLQNRGLVPHGPGMQYAVLQGFQLSADGVYVAITGNGLKSTCYNGLHTTEFLRADANNGYNANHNGSAYRGPVAYAVAGCWVLNPDYPRTTLNAGYPGLPLVLTPAKAPTAKTGLGKAFDKATSKAKAKS